MLLWLWRVHAGRASSSGTREIGGRAADRQSKQHILGFYRHRREAQISRRLRPTRVPLAPNETPNRKQWGAFWGAWRAVSRFAPDGRGALVFFFFEGKKSDAVQKRKRTPRASGATPPFLSRAPRNYECMGAFSRFFRDPSHVRLASLVGICEG